MGTLILCAISGRSARGGAACEAARVVSPPPAGREWRAALDELVAATAVQGQPWSCGGARIGLRFASDGSAELTVEDAQGRTAVRPVASPEDLLATGEALLAAPLLGSPESPRDAAKDAGRDAEPPTSQDAAPGGEPPAPQDAAPVRPAAPAPPRLVVDALLSGRFAGPTQSFWPGGLLRATLPFDAWSAGVWARFDAPARFVYAQKHDLSMTGMSIGVAIERRLLRSPFELRLGFEPSLAVVSMTGGEVPGMYDGATADVRLGLALRAVFPVGRAFRIVAGIDGEAAPAAAGSQQSRLIDPELPPVPAFTLGVTLGAGVGLL